MLLTFPAHAASIPIDNLSGQWAFRTGDDLRWARPDFDDRAWPRLEVPLGIGEQGYAHYSGRAWYRRLVTISANPQQPLGIRLGHVANSCEVYVNGVLVGRIGSVVPPKGEGRWSHVIELPPHIIGSDRRALIAVRVWRSHGSAAYRPLGGGLDEGSIAIGPLALVRDPYISNFTVPVNLAGEWAFCRGDDPRWKELAFDDSRWKRIHVPTWIGNGKAPTFDGYAWYRMSLLIDPDLMQRDHSPLGLTVGPAGDAAEVYVNGQKIGGEGVIPPHPRISQVAMAPLLQTIPPGLLRQGHNVLAVRVWRSPYIQKHAPNESGGLFGNADRYLLGDRRAISDRLALVRSQLLIDAAPHLVLGLVYLLVAVMHVELYRRRRGLREYIWFAALSFDLAFIAFTNPEWSTSVLLEGRLMSPLMSWWVTAGVFRLITEAVIVLPFLFSRFLGEMFPDEVARFAARGVWQKSAVHWYEWSLLAFVVYLIAPASMLGLITRAWELWITPLLLGWIVLLCRAAWSRNREARDIIIGFSLFAVTVAIDLGQDLGWLSVPRYTRLFGLTSYEFGFVAIVAAMVLSLSGRFTTVSAAVETYQAELDAARRVQSKLLPTKAPQIPGLDIAGACIPAKEVGGDYYDFIAPEDGGLFIPVADVSGKGLSAALLMTLTKGSLLSTLQQRQDLVEALTNVNSALRDAAEQHRFVSMAVVHLRADGTLSLLRAGHNPPLLCRADTGEVTWLRPRGIALGMAASRTFAHSCATEEIRLDDGDVLVLYTDGVVEAMNGRSEEYGEERFAAIVRANAARSATAIHEAIVGDVTNFRNGTAANDDLTVVVLRAETAAPVAISEEVA